MQKEKEVLALLSRLDVHNVRFTNIPPGMFPFKSLYLLAKNWICTSIMYVYQLVSDDEVLNKLFR